MQREKQSLAEKSVQPQSSELDVEQVPSMVSDGHFHSNTGEKFMSQKFDFNSLVAAEKQQSRDDHAEYQDVLREIANDECNRPESEILRLLERCERDTSDLKSDVEWRITRDKQIAELKRENEYRTKNAELLARLQAMRSDFDKVYAEYEAARRPIIGESNSLNEKLQNIENYRDDLFESCRDIHLKLELEILESSFDHRTETELYARQNHIKGEITQLEYQRDRLPITQDRQERKKALKHEISRLQAEWEQLEIKKGEVAQKNVEHQQAIAALWEKMIFS